MIEFDNNEDYIEYSINNYKLLCNQTNTSNETNSFCNTIINQEVVINESMTMFFILLTISGLSLLVNCIHKCYRMYLRI